MIKQTLILTALGFILSGCGRETKQEEFRIGVLAPITGVMSGHGQSIVMGARVAERELNERGGILGKSVKLASVSMSDGYKVA